MATTNRNADLQQIVGHWSCTIDFFDPGYQNDCPRCGKPCSWGCSITVYSAGPISRGTLYWPMCHCPDGHVREAIKNILVEILVKSFRDEEIRRVDSTSSVAKPE